MRGMFGVLALTSWLVDGLIFLVWRVYFFSRSWLAWKWAARGRLAHELSGVALPSRTCHPNVTYAGRHSEVALCLRGRVVTLNQTGSARTVTLTVERVGQ